ncbi:MAG: hypothetical protein ABIO67_09770 [Mycobacteriales bacterium]
MVKRSVSFPADVFEGLEAEAKLEGVGVSAAIAEAATRWLRIRQGLRGVAEWEAEHGAFTAEEIAAADAILDAL